MPPRRTRALAVLTPRTNSKLCATAPLTLGGASLRARWKGGPCTLTRNRRQACRCLSIPGQARTPSRARPPSRVSATSDRCAVDSVFSSGVCWGGMEGGRTAQSREGDADPRGRCGVAGARFGSALHSSLSRSVPDSGAPQVPDAAAAGVNSAPGKSIRDAQGPPIGLQRVAGSGLRARTLEWGLPVGEGTGGGRADCPSQATPFQRTSQYRPAHGPRQIAVYAPGDSIGWKAVGSYTSNQFKRIVGPMKAGETPQ